MKECAARDTGATTVKGEERGFILVTVILYLAILMVLSYLLLYKINSTMKIATNARSGIAAFEGAEGGAIAVASYMAKFKMTNVPQDVLVTSSYRATIEVLGDSINYPVGFSSLWKRTNVKINSVSPPPPNDRSEVEMVVFVPTTPVGYGNE